MTIKANRTAEAGNAFVIILLGVVLFAALMFAFTRSARQGGDNISDRQLQLTGTDITGYAQSLERAVNKTMLQPGLSENLLSFDNSFSSGYQNAGCSTDSCKVFAPAGGGGDWEAPPSESGATTWIITGANAVAGVGDDTAADLVLLLPGISGSLCKKLDAMLNVNGGSPPQVAAALSVAPFTGVFANTARISDSAVPPVLTGVHAACVSVTASPAENVFYAVLMER